MPSDTSKSTSPPKNKLTSKQYENLGRIVASVYESGYLDAAKSYRMTFFKGVIGGFGGVIGATIVVAIVLGILSQFDQIPLIERIIRTLETPKP